MNHIPRPGPDEFAPFYAGYVDCVRGEDALQHMADDAETMQASLAGVDDARAAFRYEPGKWSIKQVVGHMADAERLFAFRALCFARGDAGPLPSMDQEAWMAGADFDARPFGSIVEELRRVRLASLALFESIAPPALDRTGVASGNRFTVRSLAWIVAGHAAHHMHVLRSRYGVR